MAGFGFGPQSTLSPYGADTLPPTDADMGQGVAPSAAPPGWSPSAWAVFSHAMSGNGEMGAAKQDLINQHLAQMFAQKDATLQAAAMAGKSPELQFAIHHDPKSFATNANQTFGFHTVGGGDAAVAGGVDLGVNPKTSSPAETTTSNAATIQAAAAAQDAATKAAEQADKALMTPAQIRHLNQTGEAALIAARKQPGGGVKPGAPKPTGRVF